MVESKSTAYIWMAFDEFLKLSEPVSSSVKEILVPISSDLLELNKIMCISASHIAKHLIDTH